LLLADVSEHEHGSVAALVQEDELVEGVEVHCISEASWNDVLDDFLPEHQVPVIIDFPKLVIDFFLLIFFYLVYETVLFFNELLHL